MLTIILCFGSIGWLFLFAVLYAAALLFGMVFFVRLRFPGVFFFPAS